MDLLQLPFVFGLFLLSISVTLAHDIQHHSAFFPSTEHNSLCILPTVVAVPLAPVPACRLAFFPSAGHNSFSGPLAFVPVPLVPVPACRSVFFPFVECNSLSAPLAVVPVPPVLVPAYECVEWTSQKISPANTQ